MRHSSGNAQRCAWRREQRRCPIASRRRDGLENPFAVRVFRRLTSVGSRECRQENFCAADAYATRARRRGPPSTRRRDDCPTWRVVVGHPRGGPRATHVAPPSTTSSRRDVEDMVVVAVLVIAELAGRRRRPGAGLRASRGRACIARAATTSGSLRAAVPVAMVGSFVASHASQPSRCLCLTTSRCLFLGASLPLPRALRSASPGRAGCSLWSAHARTGTRCLRVGPAVAPTRRRPALRVHGLDAGRERPARAHHHRRLARPVASRVRTTGALVRGPGCAARRLHRGSGRGLRRAASGLRAAGCDRGEAAVRPAVASWCQASHAPS